jgi:hypothetical protein
LVDLVVISALEDNVFYFLDDIVMVNTTFKDHICLIEEVLWRLWETKLQPSSHKCQFGRKELTYLGHQVTEKDIATDPEKIIAILALTPSVNVKELHHFNGVICWFCRFVTNVAILKAPFNELIYKKAKWLWSNRRQQAFEEVKAYLAKVLVLVCPKFQRTFVFQTDVRDDGFETILTQKQRGKEWVIANVSRTLNWTDRNYSAIEKKCLAIKWGI